MKPWVSKFAGCDVINFVFYNDQVGKLVERIFDDKRYLVLVINEVAFADALLEILEKKLCLSESLEVVKRVRLDDTGRCGNKPTISLSLGSNLIEVTYAINSLHVSFPISRFVEEAINHLQENPVIYLYGTAERNQEFKRKWQEMLDSLNRATL